MLQQALREADKAAGGTVLDAGAEQALAQLAAGSALTSSEAQSLAQAARRANAAAVEPGGGGLLQVARLEQAVQAVQKIAPLPMPPRAHNPFGQFAGVLIAKKKYDPKRARNFKRHYTDWLPYLTAWDAILRLMASEGGIEYRFKPGFVLEDGVVGMCAQGKNGGIIYVNPDRFKEYATAHAERPMALASFLHQLAAHELAHLQRGGGDGHSEEFSSTREALGRSTAHLIPAFAVLCASVLRLPVKESPEQTQIRELKKQLERGGGAGKGDVGRLRQQIARLEAERAAALADAARASSRAVSRSCPDCVRRVEEAVQVLRRHLPADLPRARLERLVTSHREKLAAMVEEHDRRAAAGGT
ncbi:hypothetical protein OV203_46640 [Nannocystis sp. ILAH1]|uniref:hypothetical protein n=1 Tax=Nannocystis sp. ILAH1 TaxID=2996789 RepID=UPI00226D42C7|nr:hypothetical protein [Nannocystis sp. ILAH1]MCY0994693.1 hypothetical protein [Nannocystis sp. ILAH1]